MTRGAVDDAEQGPAAGRVPFSLVERLAGVSLVLGVVVGALAVYLLARHQPVPPGPEGWAGLDTCGPLLDGRYDGEACDAIRARARAVATPVTALGLFLVAWPVLWALRRLLVRVFGRRTRGAA